MDTYILVSVQDINYIISRIEEIEWDINVQLHVKEDIQKLLLGEQITLDEEGIKNKVNIVNKSISDLEKIFEEAPVDFLGTGSNGQVADKEEREWRNRYQIAIKNLKEYQLNQQSIDKPVFKRKVLQPIYEKFIQEFGYRSAEAFYRYLLRLNITD